MNFIIGMIGNNETVKYAYDEMVRLLRRMDSTTYIDLRIYNERIEEKSNLLWLGMDGTVKEDKEDEIYISVKGTSGIITGANPRSVLMAVYRFMYELGCKYLYPSAQGEIVPTRKLTESDLNIFVNEKPSYRYRAIALEAAVGYEHVRNIIEWLPKVGMNAYYIPFYSQMSFFQRLYNEDPAFGFAPIKEEDIILLRGDLENEVRKRGLEYHVGGHGWHCEPFGIHAPDWGVYKGEISDEVRGYLAQIDGVRQLWTGKPMNTNLCYSNPKVREIMTDAVVAFCKEHPADFVSFCVGDDKNNHCECEKCREKLPSDFYVMMLNELDEKLTAEGMDIKVKLSLYQDLLWIPEHEKINNPDRFAMGFAPIDRTYTHSYAELDTTKKFEIAPYVRNRLAMPTSVEENLFRLSKWQEFVGTNDGYVFDYHLLWDQAIDPGYYQCAKILHEDMTNLDKIGLNGMISCQAQRVAFPTGLPIYSMVKGLWDKNSKFEDVCQEYFSATYGEDASKVENYMATLSELFDPSYMRGEKTKDVQGITKKYNEAKQVIEKFRAENISVKENSSPYWKNLKYHADMCIRYADTVIKCISCDDEVAREVAKTEFAKYIFDIDINIHEIFDAANYVYAFRKHLSNVERL